MKDNKFLKGFILGILLTAVLGMGIYSLGIGSIGVRQQTAGEIRPDSRQANEKIKVLKSLIDEQYLGEVDVNQLTESMYAGLINGLDDPFSRYFTEAEYQSMMETTEGSYKGIGVVMQQDSDTGLITVVRCYEGAPGAAAGILPGDVIYKVDGEEVGDMELSDVAAAIRSPDTKTVTLELIRDGEADYIEVEVTKEAVEIPAVSYEMLEEQVGYIAIYEFTAVTPKQFEEALSDLKAQGMEKLVVDLRDNPGGLLTSVCEVLNNILAEELIVYTEDKNGNREEVFSEGEARLDIPLAVLVNGNSASASEIFAGAVQDYEIGTLVGTTTYGKGVVQKITQLSDGSAVKLTVSEYFTPKGRSIHETGITPDVEIELDETLKTELTISKEEDNQLQKALEILKEK